MKKLVCKICGCEISPEKYNHYISRDIEKSGVSAALSGTEPTLYDTFDCPVCGCQFVAQERKRVFDFHNLAYKNPTPPESPEEDDLK